MPNYFDSIREYELLTKEQELELSEKIQKGINAQKQLMNMKKNMRFMEARQLGREIAEGRQAEETFTKANLRMVISIAKPIAQKENIPLEDVIQEGNIGLMEAVKKYDAKRGYRFSTYATSVIRCAILDSCSKLKENIAMSKHSYHDLALIKKEVKNSMNYATVSEIAQATQLTESRVAELLPYTYTTSIDEPVYGTSDEDVTYGDVITDTVAQCPESVIEDAEEHKQFSKAVEIAGLTEKEEKFLKFRYGYYGEPHTMSEAADFYGICTKVAQNIEKRALSKLRNTKSVMLLQQI